ncbi:MAG: ChrR family anti-sigma-E factor [Rhodobacter sp.]|jgi:putative transcriptional regulator|nr:cupin domain-containing protein [Rhodobacter sp.]MCE2748539.1 ChrR family anti-sigma-E factor [Rhodobacter sp.]
MTIRHHLSDPLLMAYSAGQLPEAFSLVVATHVSLCDDCRARLLAFDAIGGALIEDADQARMAEDSFEATMARITGLPQAGPVRASRIPGSVFPAPLRDWAGGDLSAVRWRFVGMGVRQAILKTDHGATARLLHIPAGQAVPDHGHRGLELTLVLQGAFRDTEDRFGPGDVEIATEELDHTPVAEPGADCICLVATDAPLRFNRLIPRIAQPFLRI